LSSHVPGPRLESDLIRPNPSNYAPPNELCPHAQYSIFLTDAGANQTIGRYALKVFPPLNCLRTRNRLAAACSTAARRPRKIQTSSRAQNETLDSEGWRPSCDMRRFHHRAEDVFAHHGGLPDDVCAAIENQRAPIWLERRKGTTIPGANDQ